MYTIHCLGNMVGCGTVQYNNQPIDLLLDMVVKSIKNGEPVWFGCEVSKRFAMKLGIQDLTMLVAQMVFGIQCLMQTNEK